MSERASLWVYRILALMIAIGMWYVTAAETRENQAVKEITAGITYTNKPDNLVLISQAPEVRVEVAGNSQAVRLLRPWDVDVLVDLSDLEAGTVNLSLDPEIVALPDETVRVLDVVPNVITLELDVLERRSVPVVAEIVGEPAAGAIVQGTTVTPAEALIEGPRTYVSQVTRLTAGPVSLDTHAFSFEDEVPVIAPNSLVRVVRPLLVMVRISLEQPSIPGSEATN